jgi:hypothetical protein
MTIDELIESLRKTTNSMVFVKDGDFVLAEHTNTFIDFVTTALELLNQIYENFKRQTNKELENVEAWIKTASKMASKLEKRKYGDIVVTRDHNLVIDILKHIEASLIEIKNNF